MTLLFHKMSDKFSYQITVLFYLLLRALFNIFYLPIASLVDGDFNKRESVVYDNALKVLNFQEHL